MEEKQARMISALQLAYMGDSVCDIHVRRHLLSNTTLSVQKLHRRSTGMVNAGAQAAALRRLEPELTEAEREIVQRGRGTSSRPPKNCDHATYRQATAFEALLGYLYLSGQERRIDELMEACIGYWEGDHAENGA